MKNEKGVKKPEDERRVERRMKKDWRGGGRKSREEDEERAERRMKKEWRGG